MTEPFPQPIFFIVDEDPAAVEALAGDLERRFRADYRVVGETSAAAALERLAELGAAGEQVALIICYESMRAMPGSELLAHSRTVHPGAKRILLIDHDDQRLREVIARGMALGHIEYYLTKPWRPRQHLLYPVIGEALAAWTRVNWPGLELVRIVGDRWHPASHELRDALERNNVPYGFDDRDSPEGAELLAQLDQVPDHPVIFLADGRVLTSYTQADIAEAVGAQVRPKRDSYDLVVVGAGPAGLSAAVYGASEGLSTLVLESVAMGGQAGTSSRIRNFLGFPAGISGGELAERAFQQAWMFGAEFVFINGAAGLSARRRAGGHAGRRRPGERPGGGAGYRRHLPAAGHARHRRPCRRRGVLRLGAIGGTSGQGPGRVHRRRRELRRAGGRLPRQVGAHGHPGGPRGNLAKGMSDYLVKEIEHAPRVRVRLQTEVAAARGDRRLAELILRDRRTGGEEVVPAAALFVMIGATPYTGWLPGAVLRDQQGTVLTGRDLAGQHQGGAGRLVPLPLETSLPGVFAAGDVRVAGSSGWPRPWARGRSPSPRFTSTCSARRAGQLARRVGRCGRCHGRIHQGPPLLARFRRLITWQGGAKAHRPASYRPSHRHSAPP